MVETIIIKAEQKKSLSPLATVMGNLGFTKISYLKNVLVIEKAFGYGLKGEAELDYRITFSPNQIALEYDVPKNMNKKARLLGVLPVFLNVLQLVEDYYTITPSAIYFEINSALGEAVKLVGKDAVELATELSEMQAKHRSMAAKYDGLLKSSEENARILLECERKRDELTRRVERLTKYSDDAIKEMLYEWVKLHGGRINLLEFSKIHHIPIPRVEDGLDMLVKEGYIKRRFD